MDNDKKVLNSSLLLNTDAICRISASLGWRGRRLETSFGIPWNTVMALETCTYWCNSC